MVDAISPKTFKQPIINPKDYEYVITFYNGTVAFDPLYIGSEKFPYKDTFAISESGVS